MGYACPVCEAPQADAEHLANHLAFTAILRGEEHEVWLDDHVPDWSEQSPETLGPVVVDHAEEVELDVSEEDIEQYGKPPMDQGAYGTGTDELSEQDRAVLAEARELTRQMLEDADAETTVDEE